VVPVIQQIQLVTNLFVVHISFCTIYVSIRGRQCYWLGRILTVIDDIMPSIARRFIVFFTSCTTLTNNRINDCMSSMLVISLLFGSESKKSHRNLARDRKNWSWWKNRSFWRNEHYTILSLSYHRNIDICIFLYTDRFLIHRVHVHSWLQRGCHCRLDYVLINIYLLTCSTKMPSPI
jgi:hypothetical protein